jgi:DNA-binding MarR family transcriptional regulator
MYSTKLLSSYIKYLKFEIASNQRYELDTVQIRVLNEILFCYAKGQDIKVGDILSNREIASQATSHVALKKLVEKGLITYQTVSDNRTKYLVITKLGHKRFAELAKAAACA